MLSLTCPPVRSMLYQWVALVDDLDETDEGIQGYLRLSVAVVGPGDKIKVGCSAHMRRLHWHTARTSWQVFVNRMVIQPAA
jgi:hypothetical protein